MGIILSLMFCVAANASVFNMLSAIALRPLPFPESQRLVALKLGPSSAIPQPYYDEWARASHAFVSVAAYFDTRETLAGVGDPAVVNGAVSTGSLAGVLRAVPAMGRFINAADEQSEAAPVIVLSHEVWRDVFKGDSSIVGRTLRISGKSATVVGVMQEEFAFPRGAGFWLPLHAPKLQEPINFYHVIARLREGSSAAQTQRELSRMRRPIVQQLDANLAKAPAVVVSLHDWLYGSARPALLMIFAAALALLLIGCANIANLVVARTIKRAHEFGVRVALGCTHASLVRQVMGECLLLSGVGSAAGLLLSFWLTRVFVSTGPKLLGSAGAERADYRVVMFTIALSVLTAVVTGLLGAVKAAGQDPVVLLNGAGMRTAGTGQKIALVRRGLVIVQVAVAMLLTTSAGLLGKSLVKVAAIHAGVDDKRVLVISLNLPETRYPTFTIQRRFVDDLIAEIRELPGVRSAAYGTSPLGGYQDMHTGAADDSHAAYSVAADAVGPGYFAAYGIPIIAGREMRTSDDSGSLPVVVINQSAAKLIFGDRDPLGRAIAALSIRREHPIVVGVSADVPQWDMAVHPLPEAYLSLAQAGGFLQDIAVRTEAGPDAVLSGVRQLLRQRDPDLAIRERALEGMVAASTAPHRFTTMLVVAFAILAVTISAVGLFGLIAYIATQRTREIGVRIALGASRANVAGMIMREAMALAGLGILLGCVLALSLGNVLASFLFEVQSRDAGVFILSGVLLGIIAWGATLTPAIKAALIEPTIALSSD